MPALSFDRITTDRIASFNNYNIEVEVLRLDKVDAIISGNKWFKLRYYIDEAKATDKKGILTFGGAWSNHIVATAAACQLHRLQSIGIIRGEESLHLSNTLKMAKDLGMQLIFISRSSFQKKEIPSDLNISEYAIVDEGGYGRLGAKGASTILNCCNKSYTHYCCAVGTGTMMAGIINGLSSDQQILGISVLKNNFSLSSQVQSLLDVDKKNWSVLHDYSFNGYAKHTPELLQFMNAFYRQTGVPTDFVYTGKLFYAVTDLVEKNYFPPGSKILVIHSGGLQGNDSLKEGTLLF
ncbi:1-aminocyclopropane-1-carboxylate deaminase/D-cysteine desulfhydrase [Terrimonas pollutisoli]|uniref:1-aminocyclopropane-1-carboxylate deaminase/D-cysteine desulfhydrase n=1 Tax=Terrimonas pollutisoli TaxID=3034147 RepID=UPI0023EC91FB|nr:pyridoxal-phosphate dependent enzyme [Terrimonas sp. H1YJ31]